MRVTLLTSKEAARELGVDESTTHLEPENFFHLPLDKVSRVWYTIYSRAFKGGEEMRMAEAMIQRYRKMQPTLGNVRKLAAELGATIETGDEFRARRVEAVAPDGKCWEPGRHTTLCLIYPGEKSAECYADLIDRMVCGLEDCPPDCDCLHENNEEVSE